MPSVFANGKINADLNLRRTVTDHLGCLKTKYKNSQTAYKYTEDLPEKNQVLQPTYIANCSEY